MRIHRHFKAQAGKNQVTCHCCSGHCKKLGFYENRNRRVQRYYCTRCAKSFSEAQPLDNLRLDHAKVVQIVTLLCEGVGIRATARIVGCYRNTVLSVLETVGAKCVTFLDRKLRNLTVSSLQIDELWSKVGCRQIRTTLDDTEHGDFYTYLALDARTKFIMAYHTGKRDYANTDAFISDLADRIVGRVQITCDGWQAYPQTIRKHLLERLDLAVVIKLYGQEGAAMLDSVRRYSPPVCTGTRTRIRAGSPRRDRISTSYIERVNLSVRTFNRRFTRLCVGYSKKLSNHRFAVALFVAHYNFCKLHSTLNTSPAHGQQLTDHLWTTEELIQNLSETN